MVHLNSANKPQHLRTVVFATHVAHEDIPASKKFPSALLSFGAKSFIEQIFEELSDAGIRDVDLVVSDQPEAIRLVVGNGERWGLNLRWHLVKNSNKPYAMLSRVGGHPEQRVLIGHADSWISGKTINALLDLDGAAYTTHADAQWSGWASVSQSVFENLSTDSDMEAIAVVVRPQSKLQCLVADYGHFASARTAKEFLYAQQLAVNCEAASLIPKGWIPMPWGAMSPNASIHPNAIMLGPVLAGPGCLVYAGARIGPNVVLADDVVVSSGATVSNSLVMSGTYLGSGADLHDAIARGNVIQNVRLGKRVTVSSDKSSMMLINQEPSAKPGWMGRTLAAFALLLLSPLAAVDVIHRFRKNLPTRWINSQVVVDQHESTLQLKYQTVRISNAVQSRYGQLVSVLGALLDVAQGARCWFGIRPRCESEWMELGAEWKLILSNVPIGLFHAPAWQDRDKKVGREAYAAADAYISVSNSWIQRLGMCCSILKSAVQSRQPLWSAYQLR